MGRLDFTLLQSYKKIFFPRDLFVLTLNDCFVTPERLHFSVAPSENKSILKKQNREM